MAKRVVWVPWLMSEDGLSKKVELRLGKEFRHTHEITEFFKNMHVTHPHLVGAKIQFEETPLN